MPKMGDYAKTSTFETAEAGVYSQCRFIEMKPIMRGPFKGETVQTPGLRWFFKTTLAEDANSEGNDRTFRLDTGDAFGAPNAALTKLMEWMTGRKMSVEEFENFDTDELLPVAFDLTIDCKESNGKFYNNITGIARTRRSRAATPAPEPAPSQPAQKLNTSYDRTPSGFGTHGPKKSAVPGGESFNDPLDGLSDPFEESENGTGNKAPF